MSKPVLVSMMKNEAENVLCMLASVEGVYDTFVIGFDSKSTDETRNLVIQYMEDHDRSGIFYEFDWHDDFSEARNNYLTLANENLADHPWLLIMDGDDLLSPGDPDRKIPDGREEILRITNIPLENFPFKAVNFYVYLDPSAYGIPALFYPRVHLVRNLPDVRFEFASHNAITVVGPEQILLRECVILHHQHPQKRAEREVQRIEMNIPNLKAQGEAGNENRDARGYFYLGNTLLDAGDVDGAIDAYEKYLEISTWADERYQAYVHMASAYMMKGDFVTAQQVMRKGVHEPQQWSRAEGYMLLSDCALASGDTTEAIHWIKIAIECKPQTSGLFLQGHLYTWFPHWRLAMLFDRIGYTADALYHAQQAARWNPEPHIAESIQILANQLAGMQAQAKPITTYDDNEAGVAIYQMSENDVYRRLGIAGPRIAAE